MTTFFPVTNDGFAATRVRKSGVRLRSLVYTDTGPGVLHTWDMEGFESFSIQFRQYLGSANKFIVEGSNDLSIWVGVRMHLQGERPSVLAENFIPANDKPQTFVANKAFRYYRLRVSLNSPSSTTAVEIFLNDTRYDIPALKLSDYPNYTWSYVSSAAGDTSAAAVVLKTNGAPAYQIAVTKAYLKNRGTTGSDVSIVHVADIVLWRCFLDPGESIAIDFDPYLIADAAINVRMLIATAGAAIVSNIFGTQVNSR